ncbi:IclR family transcriptional regulator [Saccharopolyspora rhizosphaerae]|uniref:IclR family transcriptional regulator n=1 Tax=Saccharopolyspora rhizosphaerae TaxID=2492662 RepID=A0A426K060_9PSEU|nr:IclR family transcriptional regulator [Saccharopolyspora rhizosphaerae]RRO18711.1 IclR family transcriptional regulator [Saccharopolyspora rhizosphaerae]
MPVAETGAAKAHRTVSRITTILELAATHRNGVRLASLAAELDAPRSSLHGLVKGLVATGYLREDDGTYTIGPAVGALLAAAPPTVAEAARPAMERLHERFNETVMLATLVGGSVVYTDTLESTQPIRYSAPLSTRRPLHPTSSGKCFLAFGSERFRESHLTDLPRREEVRRELAQIAEEGVAINRGETLPDISGVGAPIFDSGRVVAAIAVAGPTTRVADIVTEIAEATRTAARDVSHHLTDR